MAEPANTPVPASTPRSQSPAPPGPNPPIIPITANPSSPLSPTKLSTTPQRPRVLHLGDPVRYNPHTYASLSGQCEIVRPDAPDRQREQFVAALRERRWGDFHAIVKPFWGTGGEMGRWDRELIDLLPATVRVFASAGAGYDWADVKYLGERGIVYCNSGLASAEAVADFAIAMIISTFRHLPWCTSAASSGDPLAFAACHKDVTSQSHNLRGHVLGIIGMGNIGQQIAARCRHGFGMLVHYYDIAPVSASVESALGGNVTSHATLEGLIRASDCIVLCVPAAEDATAPPLIGFRELTCFTRGSRLVNVARGSLVDEKALADALESGHLSAVALDVHVDEPRVNERLRNNPRAMLTCHNAGGTVETHRGFEELSMRNVMAVLAGGKPITPVNLQYLK